MPTIPKDVLGAIKEMGIDVEWVQVGNETHQGMLFPTGQTTSSDGIKNFAKFINSGYNAVKEIYPNAKVIVHLDQGNDANLYNRIFGYLHDNNAKWDVIGMSLYPDMYPTEGVADDWEDMNNKCIANMKNLIAKYNTPVMMCEIGIPGTIPKLKTFHRLYDESQTSGTMSWCILLGTAELWWLEELWKGHV